MKEFERIHPVVLAVYFAALLVICMFVMNPVISITALSGGLAFSAVNGDGRAIHKRILLYFALFILVTVSNPLFSHNGATPLFFLNGKPVTLEAYIYGSGMGLMLIAVLEWCRSLSKIMSSEKIIYLIGNAFPKLALVLSMSLKFIPVFVRQMKSIKETQTCMGMYEGQGYFEKLKNNLEIFKAQVGISIEQSIDTAASMNARGYGAGRRSRFLNFRFSIRDYVFLFLICVLTAFIAFGMGQGLLDFYYYPEIRGINTEQGTVLTFMLYGILCFMPFVMELLENIKWKYSTSKI